MSQSQDQERMAADGGPSAQNGASNDPATERAAVESAPNGPNDGDSGHFGSNENGGDEGSIVARVTVPAEEEPAAEEAGDERTASDALGLTGLAGTVASGNEQDPDEEHTWVGELPVPRQINRGDDAPPAVTLSEPHRPAARSTDLPPLPRGEPSRPPPIPRSAAPFQPSNGGPPVVSGSLLPDLPPATPPHEDGSFAPLGDADVKRWEASIVEYEREAKALGDVPTAAALHLEIGRIYEEKLGRPRNAASAYQSAFNLDPASPAILHASRRLFSEVGNWAMVVQIIGYEIDHASRPEEKATLFSEKGAIQEYELREVEAAQASYEAALDAWSAEPLALGALERLHLSGQRYEALFGVYERALEVESAPERRLPLLLAAAHLAEDRLEEPQKAIALYRESLGLDAAHPVALSALRRLHQQAGEEDALVQVLERSGEVASDPAGAAQYLLSAARVATNRLENTDEALRLLEKGLGRAPGDLSTLRELELLHRQAERQDGVIDVLRRAAKAAREPRDRAAIYHRLGRALERSGDLDGAVGAARAALESEPGYAPAAQALGRALQQLDRPEDLALLYQIEIDAESDPQERIVRLFKLAELKETRLGDDEGAIRALRSLLEIQREYPPARKRLERLLLKREAYEDLVALHEEEVELTTDTELRIFLLGRIGQLAEEKLGDRLRAKNAMTRLLELSPRHLGAIRALSRIAELDGNDSELLRLLELEAEATDDQAEVLALMHRRARLLVDRLDDSAAARDVLDQILTLNPTYLPALRSLGRIHASEGRWQELLDMHQRELEVTRSPRHRVDLLFRIAQLREERLEDLDSAVAAYESLLEIDENNLPASRALSDLYARRGEVEKLADLRLAEVERIESPREQAATLLEVAELFDERLDRGDKAAELYQRVLRLGYAVDAATRALVRIYSREGLWNALAGALRTAAERAEDPQTESAILVRSAQIHADKLKNQNAAAELLERAASLMPGDRSIMEQLERVSVARRDWGRALQVGERLAEMESDPRAFAARKIRLATLEENQLDPPRPGAEHYRRALEAVPNHPVALRALESAYLASRDWAGLAAVHVREALTATERPGHRAGLFVRAAELHDERLQQPEEATRLYDLALEADGKHLPALRGRRRMAERTGDTHRLLELLETEEGLTADRERASELLFETGRVLQDQLGDVNRAVTAYEGVLERDAASLAAFNRLEAIFLEREDFARVKALLEGRAAAVSSAEEQARLYVSAGRIAEERMTDRKAAIAAYRSALEREPKNPAALVRLGPLLFAERAWPEAVDAFHRTLAVSKDPPILRDAFKSLGIIYQEHEKDLVKSVQSFQAALQADPSDTESLYRLASLYRGANDWGSAINVMLRLAEVEPDPDGKTSALLDLADLYLEGPKDASLAITALRKAVEIDAGCRPALSKLCELHEQREEWQELVEAAGAYVNLLGPDERAEATPLHLRMADVFERRLGDNHRAINALRYVLEDQPEHEAALTKLAGLYGKRVETYPQAIEAQRRLLSLDPFRIDSYHELHRMFERLGQHDRAFVAAEILVFLQAQTPEEYVYFQENKIYVAQMSEDVLTAAEHGRWVVHPDERGPLRTLLELLGPEMGRAYPGDLERHDLKRENKLGPKMQSPVRALADELTAMLEVPPYDLYIGAPDGLAVHTENERPPALIVGGRFAKRVPIKNQRFLLGRALERVKGGHLLMDAANDRDLEALVWSVIKLGHPMHKVPVDPSSLDSAQRRFAKAISSKTRRVLEDIAAQLPVHHVDIPRHRQAAQFTANRAGLLASNDIETAIRILAKSRSGAQTVFRTAEEASKVLGQLPEVCDLLTYAVSDEYFDARAKLGFSIQD